LKRVRVQALESASPGSLRLRGQEDLWAEKGFMKRKRKPVFRNLFSK